MGYPRINNDNWKYQASRSLSWAYLDICHPEKRKRKTSSFKLFTGLNFAFGCFGCSRSARLSTTSYWIFRVSNENHATLHLGPLLELFEGRHWETGLNILEIGSDYLQLFGICTKEAVILEGIFVTAATKYACKTWLTHQTCGSGQFFRLPVVVRENKNVRAFVL